MEIYEKIRDMLNSSVSEIFTKIADEYKIIYTECPPDLEYDIDEAVEGLAGIMKEAVEFQFE